MAKILYVIICFLFLFAFSTNAYAQKHKVKKGETLYDIARNNAVSVKDIKKTNNLSTSRIHPGDVIVIPGRSARKSKDKNKKLAKAGTNKSIKSNELTETISEFNPHIIERGENLYRIALRFGTTVNEIKKINKLKGNSIKVGQKIRVPVVEHEEELPDRADESVLETDVADATDGEELQAEDENALNNALVQNNVDAVPDNGDSQNWFFLIDKAMDYLGVPYRFGGSSLKGIDCSAFVQTVYKYFSIDLPRTAREQFKAGVKVSKKEQLRIGDLIFFRTYAKYPSHVGIYVGEGKMIHASSREKKVTITSINEPYYNKRYIGAVRLPENLPNLNAEDIKAFAN